MLSPCIDARGALLQRDAAAGEQRRDLRDLLRVAQRDLEDLLAAEGRYSVAAEAPRFFKSSTPMYAVAVTLTVEQAETTCPKP